MKKVMKSRHFTLLEVLIALLLSSVLLSFLLFTYLFLERTNAYWKERSNELFVERALEVRLKEVFSHLIPPDQKNEFFFTEHLSRVKGVKDVPSLVFSYDNGACLDARFSGEQLGRIFLDEEGRLIFMTWKEASLSSNFGPAPYHSEILFSRIEMFNLSFLVKRPTDGVLEWIRGSYSKQIPFLPLAIRLDLILKDGKTMALYFPIEQTLLEVRRTL